MKVGVTGTPGTGKTTATELVDERLDAVEVVHVNELIEREELYTDVDERRESVVADLEAIETRLEAYGDGDGDGDGGRDGDSSGDRDIGGDDAGEAPDLVVESHLAHHVDLDRVAVLRCRPEALESRLLDRGESAAKASENAESEALDVILSEAVEAHGRDAVYEIDTTDRPPEGVADALVAVIEGEREPSAGEVDFVGYLT